MVEENFQYYPQHILKSVDNGLTWAPVLHLKNLTPIYFPSNSADYKRAQVMEIAIHPNDADIVYAATTRGLFHTDDGGARWYELGKSYIRFSNNHGKIWSTCNLSNCTTKFSDLFQFKLGISNNGKIPSSSHPKISVGVNNPHYNNFTKNYRTPTLRSVAIRLNGSDYDVYVNVVDYGYVESSDETDCASADFFPDINNDYHQGGLYKMQSSNFNSFTNLIGDGKLSSDTQLAIPKFHCNAPDDHKDTKYTTTNFTNLAVAPEGVTGLEGIDIFVGARGSYGGLYGYSSTANSGAGKWYYLGGNGNDDRKCSDYDCWSIERGYPNAYFEKVTRSTILMWIGKVGQFIQRVFEVHKKQSKEITAHRTNQF